MAPTDSRLRPDQRIMENGDFDTANNEKVRQERLLAKYQSLEICRNLVCKVLYLSGDPLRAITHNNLNTHHFLTLFHNGEMVFESYIIISSGMHGVQM